MIAILIFPLIFVLTLIHEQKKKNKVIRKITAMKTYLITVSGLTERFILYFNYTGFKVTIKITVVEMYLSIVSGFEVS